MKPTKCAFHKGETIVNFCRNQQCLLPMCPKCIKLHSLEHIKEKTPGMFDNINQLIQQIESKLGHNLRTMVEFSEILKSTVANKKTNINQLKNHIAQTKKKIIEGMVQFLDCAEAQVLLKLQDQEKGIINEFKNIDSKIDEFSHRVKGQIEAINGDSKMKTIINYLAADMSNSLSEQTTTFNQQIRRLSETQLPKHKDLNMNNLQAIMWNLKCQFTTQTLIRQSESSNESIKLWINSKQNMAPLKQGQEKKTETCSSIYSNIHR